MAVKILVDSASDISMAEAEKLGIYMIPMALTFGTEEFYDGVDILPTQFFEKLIENRELPKTSQISAFRFEEAVKPLVDAGDEVVIITISSKISSTFNNAKQVEEKFAGKVYAVDSMIASTGERILIEYAIRLVEQGKCAKEIAQELDRVKGKICLLAVMDTLEYLRKGGRISAVVAIAGTVLSIKPIISFIDGKVKMVGKAIGSKKGNNLLNKMVKEKGGIDFSMPFSTMWSGLDKSVLDKYIKDSSSLWSEHTQTVPAHLIGGTIGTHIGPNAVGVAFFTK